MALGFSHGCHRCGGYPGHKSKDRAFLVECTECGTFTCNQHLTITGGCPKCKSGKVKKVMTQRDVRKHSKGSKVENAGKASDKAKAAGKGGQGSPDGDEDMPGQGAFARGGTDLPKKNNDGPTTNFDAGDIPENLRHTEKRLQSILLEDGDNGNQMATPELSADEKSRTPETIIERQVAHEGAADIEAHTSHSSHHESESATSEKHHTHHTEATTEKLSDKPLEASKYKDLDDLFDDMPAVTNPATQKTAENQHADEEVDKEMDKERDPAQERPADEVENEDNKGTHAPEEHEDIEGEDTKAGQTKESADDLSEEEKAAIDAEFKEIAKARADALENLKDIEYMVTLARTDRKKIMPNIHLADAFWGVSKKGAGSLEETQEYHKQISALRHKAEESRENPNVPMSVLCIEPATNDLATSAKTFARIDKFDGIYYALGYGPRQAEVLNPNMVGTQVKKLYSNAEKAVAVGVTGLDLQYAPYAVEAQKALFKPQLALAIEANLPVYITARKGEQALAEVLEEAGAEPGQPRFVLTDLLSPEMLPLVQEYDMHVCLRPELTHDSQKKALDLIKQTNPARWLLCGGYSHSAPKGHETGWNRPYYLPETASKLADLLERTDENLRTLCTGNLARLLFGKPWKGEKEAREDLWAEFR